MVKFPGRLFGNVPCLADPAEVELVKLKDCVGIVKKYHHLESVHWAVRPLIVTLGLLSVLKLGMLVGHIGSKARRKIKQNIQQSLDVQTTRQDPRNSGNAPWLPPSVANIFSKKRLPLHNS